MSKRIKGVVKNESFVATDVVDGKTVCSVWVSDFDNDFHEVAGKVIELLDGEGKWCDNNSLITMNFRPSALLEYYIEGHGLNGRRDLLCADAKPKVDQLRKELQAMIDEIDAISYE